MSNNGETKAFLAKSNNDEGQGEPANKNYSAVENGSLLFSSQDALIFSKGDNNNDDGDELDGDRELSLWVITSILSTAFAYGCILTTLFLITLPVECERIENEHDNIHKSVALGMFVAIAGITQLISPLVGMLSDTYKPPPQFKLGKRLPFLAFGTILSVIGLLGQYIESYERLWIRYGTFFFVHMIGLNITYAMMIALIPDQVPVSQTGVANGILALLLVTGSLFGFALFHLFFGQHIQDMYGLYICIVISSGVLTCFYAQHRDAKLAASYHDFPPITESQRQRRRRQPVISFWMLLKTMFIEPIRNLDWKTLYASYTIDTNKHYDFFIVTISRLFYYCGMSVQTFFLYFCHDVLHVTDDPESAVAYLAILGQISGALICYPVGFVSDRYVNGRRKPFVYLACAILGCVTAVMIFYARNMHQMTILCLILGAANGIYLTMDTSLAVDTLPAQKNQRTASTASVNVDNSVENGTDNHQDNQQKNNDEQNVDGPSGGNAQLLGIWGVAAFLGSALGPMIGGPLLYTFGSINADTGTEANQTSSSFSTSSSTNNNEPAYSIYGYAVILSLSSIYFLCSAISLRWVKNPSV